MSRSFPWSIKTDVRIGIIDESDVLVKVHRDPSHFNDPVKNAMTIEARNTVAESDDQGSSRMYLIAVASPS